MTDTNDIYVQILPVIESESANKILLCKWNKGDFKNRFTGLIRAVDSKETTNGSNIRKQLEKTAASLLPSSLTTNTLKIELVAILNFTDPPAYTEYVYMVHLCADAANITDVAFDGNPCRWFRWDEIPFQEMPEDDHLWYPKVLEAGMKVTGSFTFGSWSETTLKSYHIDTVSRL